MLTFEEFQQYVRENIIEYMPVAYKNAKVFVDNTVKNNGLELVGLCVQKEGSNIGPRVYLEGAYGAYGDGAVLEDIMNSIARSIVDFVPPMEYENLGEIREEPELAKLEQIEVIPTLVLYKNGQYSTPYSQCFCRLCVYGRLCPEGQCAYTADSFSHYAGYPCG